MDNPINPKSTSWGDRFNKGKKSGETFKNKVENPNKEVEQKQKAENQLSNQRSKSWDSFITPQKKMLELEADFLGMIPYAAMGPEPFGLDELMSDVKSMGYYSISNRIIDYLDLNYINDPQYLLALTNIVNNAKQHKMGHVFNGIIYELYFILSLDATYTSLRTSLLSGVDFPQNDTKNNIDKIVNEWIKVLNTNDKSTKKKLNDISSWLKDNRGIEEFATEIGYLYRIALNHYTKKYLSSNSRFEYLIKNYKKIDDAEKEELREESLKFFQDISNIWNNPEKRLQLLNTIYYTKNDKLRGATVKDLIDGMFRDTEIEMITKIQNIKTYITENSVALIQMMGLVKSAGYETTPIYRALSQMNEVLNGKWDGLYKGKPTSFVGQDHLLNTLIDKTTFSYNVKEIKPIFYFGFGMSMKLYQQHLATVDSAKNIVIAHL